MEITKELWGNTPCGKEIFRYTMKNSSGAYVQLSNLGAGIVSIVVPDKDGKMDDVVLGYAKADSYYADSDKHNHREFNQYIQAIAAVAIKNKHRSAEYDKLIQSLFDIYLGELPATFTYKGKEYTPKTFAQLWSSVPGHKAQRRNGSLYSSLVRHK